MRRNDMFTTPMRQSYVAILLIIYNTYKIIVRQLWPFILLYVIGGSEGKRQWLMYVVGGLAVVGMVVSILKFFRFFFYIDEDELIVQSGVLSRQRLSVPFERIQTINFEQSVIHRAFDVVKLKVDTAGTEKQEFNFEALDLKTAQQLRDILITRKKAAYPSPEDTAVVTEQDKVILHLSIGELLRAGIVENHLKSGWILLAAVFWLWQNLQDAGLGTEVEQRVQTLAQSIMITVILVTIFMVISFLISLTRMVLFNYDLKFIRTTDGFKINGGFFTKKDTSAMNNKIQVVSWSDNLLKKLFKLKDLYLKQASSKEVSNSQSIKIPGTQAKHIDEVIVALYPESEKIMDFYRVHTSYFTRWAMYAGAILVVGLFFFIYMDAMRTTVAFGLFLSYLIFVRYMRYRKLNYGFNDTLIRINGGAYGDKSTVMPLHKIQAVEKSRSPYQRRKDLASLHLHTATGSTSIPYIPADKADELMDYLLYKTESSRKAWM